MHFGAVHGHMEIVGTMVTEFFTAVALQHFQRAGSAVNPAGQDCLSRV